MPASCLVRFPIQYPLRQVRIVSQERRISAAGCAEHCLPPHCACLEAFFLVPYCISKTQRRRTQEIIKFCHIMHPLIFFSHPNCQKRYCSSDHLLFLCLVHSSWVVCWPMHFKSYPKCSSVPCFCCDPFILCSHKSTRSSCWKRE